MDTSTIVTFVFGVIASLMSLVGLYFAWGQLRTVAVHLPIFRRNVSLLDLYSPKVTDHDMDARGRLCRRQTMTPLHIKHEGEWR